MDLMSKIKATAKAAGKCIVLPEGNEERTLKAADIILQEGIANLILLGNEQEIKKLASEWGLKNIDKA
ncbi:MAG: phosphate acetyltransferase, partial [Bacteroidales bacterium]|nr:phosphate acetyltransferase [Bacteroidales bacterium]